MLLVNEAGVNRVSSLSRVGVDIRIETVKFGGI